MDSRMSRRGFNRSLAAVGAVAFASPSFAQTPKTGGQIRIAVTTGGPNDTLDPTRMTTPADAVRGFQVYNTLVEVSDKLEPLPELAESWEARDGGREWVFKLRRGVEFHNGKSLSPPDVAYSIMRHLGPQSKSAAKAFLAGVTEAKADGADVVRIRLETPNADLPLLLGDNHLGISPDGYQDFDRAVGTGGFRVKEWKPGVSLVTSRNPNYWKAGRAHVDEVETFLIGDATARTNALLSGDIQVMQDVDPKAVELLQKSGKAEVIASRSGNYFIFVMMCDRTPTDDANIRLALKFAVDRERMLKTVLRGRGQLGNDHPIPPSDPFYNSELPIRPYDLDKAKFYLKKAGLQRLDIALHTGPVNIGGHDAALLFKEMAAPAGINVEIKLEPTDGYFSNIWMKRPFHVSAWRARPGTDQQLSIAYQSTAAWNETQWKQPEFDKLLVEARGTLDTAKRKQMYWELQRMIHEDGGAIIPAFPDGLDAVASNVKGFEPHPAGSLSGFRVAEKVWLQS
jgi:peptide/nickel transport system substrate-binding protein